MKTKKIILILSIFSAVVIGCNNNYPTEISFNDYSLSTSCQWKDFVCDGYDGELIIINNNEELNNYITCANDSYPVIDFSEYTLLLVNGCSPNDVIDITTSLFKKNDTNRYTLNITVHLGVLRVMDKWNISILIPKVSNNATIKLNVQQSQNI